MRKVVLLSCIMMIGLLIACASQVENPAISDESNCCYMLERFLINNTPLSEYDTSYSISELESFFSVHSIFGVADTGESETLYLDDINQKFPVTHLRRNAKHNSYYIAYPVSEGGKYLVFLGAVIDPVSHQERACYLESIYVYNLPNRETFTKLEAGDSFFDVLKIAPYTHKAVMSSANVSYSLMTNGDVMKCIYAKNGEQEWILESMEVLSSRDSRYPYNGMVPSDLIE